MRDREEVMFNRLKNGHIRVRVCTWGDCDAEMEKERKGTGGQEVT